MSIIPWSSGRLLVWDTACSDTLPDPTFLQLFLTFLPAVALQAEKLKNNKYSHLDSELHIFTCSCGDMPLFQPQTKAFLKELGHQLRSVTLNENSHQYLLQRISVAVQRERSIVGSLPCASRMEDVEIYIRYV